MSDASVVKPSQPAWVRRHPMYSEWERICTSGAGVHPPWRESPERFIRDVLAQLGKPPSVSQHEWETDWVPPAEGEQVETEAEYARRVLLDDPQFVEMYGELCDVVERAWQGWPIERGDDEAPVLHTSDYARDGANRLVGIFSKFLEGRTPCKH